ncbi:MAG: hypothetical protein JWO80_353 [Bryobacterales bacterium]|nr:hypothetical protein [Bryobacterales bacterium]
MSFSAPRGLASLSLRGILWIAVGAVVSLSYILYTPEPATRGMQPGVADWIFRSWPALFASALRMWLLLSGPIVNAPRWVQKGVRLAMVFFVYSGAIVPVESAACRVAVVQSLAGFQRRSGRWRKETRPPWHATSGQPVDPAPLCVQIRRGRWYRAGSRSQIDGPWIVLLPLQIQFRTGKGGLREEIVELFAGPWRESCGLRHVGFLAQGSQGVIKHLIRASKVAALDFLLNDPFLFGLELNGHCKYPTPH